MSFPIVTKAPGDFLDYDVDFARWLPTADYCISAVVTIEGGTVAVDSHVVTATQVKIWLSGGADGDVAEVTVAATTNDGRIKTVCFQVRVREC